jgi:hypothetical protein
VPEYVAEVGDLVIRVAGKDVLAARACLRKILAARDIECPPMVRLIRDYSLGQENVFELLERSGEPACVSTRKLSASC